MKRLEEEIEEELKESKEFGEMHEAAEEYLKWFRDGKEKYLMHGAAMLTKSFTSAPGLAILMSKMLGHDMTTTIIDGLMDTLEGSLDDLSYGVEDVTSYGAEDILFGMLKRKGVSEALWLSMFEMRPVIYSIEPELFVGILPMLRNEGMLLKMMPMILSIAMPLLQVVEDVEVFKHLGELESYEDSGLYRYGGKEED